MWCKRILGTAVLCVCLSGCRLASDITHNMVFETCLFADDVKAKVYYPILARSAWNRYRVTHPDCGQSSDFGCGFKLGYADYLENGGDGSSHPLPPMRYWKLRNETREGRAATERWLTGFRAGAAAAHASGFRELVVVPVGDRGPTPPPPALPLGPPLPTPTTPHIEELPKPHSLPPAAPPPTAPLPAVPPEAEEEAIHLEPTKNTPAAPTPVKPAKTGLRPDAAGDPFLDQLPQILGQQGKPMELPRVQASAPRTVTVSPPAPKTPPVDWNRVPPNAEMLCRVGTVLMEAGSAEVGLRWLHAALQADPNHAPTHKALMEYYQRSGDSQRAAEHELKAEVP